MTLSVRLDRQAVEPLGLQLSTQVRRLVTDGTLAEGDRLPSSRALAADLAVSRSVAEQAYDQLLAEGWLTTRRGAGTFVAGVGTQTRPRPRPRPSPPAGRHLVRLDTGTPWIDPRLEPLWRRAWRDVSAARPPRGYLDPRGLPELRAELADRLARTRGLACDADEVVVTAGTSDGLRHLLGALPDGPVGVEDPGYRAAAETVRASGREVRDLPAGSFLDAPAGLAELAAVYVTPAHQHPLGHTLSGPDRVRLLEATGGTRTVVIEDDYDSEFRYDVAPVPALASLDRDRVAYLGTASKAVLPALRIGWLVAPDPVRARIDERRSLTHDSAAWPVQLAFLRLLRDGYVDRVVRAARRVYAERGERVRTALTPYGVTAGPQAGMYLTLQTSAAAARRARTAALAAGFDVPMLGDYCRSAALDGLVVGFGGCTDAELDAVLLVLCRALG